MQTKARDLQGFIVLIVALLLGGFLLVRNLKPGVSYSLSGPTPTVTQQESSWEQVLQNQLANGSTPIPTHDEPIASLVAPTLPPVAGTPILLQPTQVFQANTPRPTRSGPPTPTRPGPTSLPSPTGQIQSVAKNDVTEGQFSLPPEIVPLSMDPRDHFWFNRPVDASANSTSLGYYAYGSDGPRNEWRIHHGLDMPNPTGKEIKASAAGRVIWASDNYVWIENGRVTDAAYTYGNVVIIEHDFGFEGQPLFTLYAHLAVIVVQPNQRVEAGDVLGLSGASGVVSGPHVHFEVRVGRNHYCDTRNPVLWMAPYLDHGVIAGKIFFSDGTPVNDATVSLLQGNKLIDTTTTYVRPDRPGSTCSVTSDAVWNENFVFGDVPAGDYQVTVNVNGLKVTRDINVRPATTAFIDLGQAPNGQVTDTESDEIGELEESDESSTLAP